MKGSTLTIAGRSISTLIKTQAIGDLYQMHELARSNHVAYIRGDFPDTSTEAFDQQYRSKLFDIGFKLGQGDTAWKKAPPRVGSRS